MDPIDDLRTKIDAFGWAVRNVSDSDPAKCLSYTVGLTAQGLLKVRLTPDLWGREAPLEGCRHARTAPQGVP